VVLAGVLYVFGAALILARYAKSSRSLTAATRAAQPIAGTKLEAVVESLRKRIGVRRFPTVLLSEEVDTPLAFGMRQPVILIPTEMAEEASVCDLESILLHEYAHLDQRHDISVWLSVLAKAMYWPNPLVHRATFELCRAREEVSDNYVLRVLPATQLARALLSVAQSRARFVPQPAAAGLMLPKWNLERRVAGLLDPTRNCETHATRFNMTAFNLTAATLCATLAGLQLVHAQDATVRVKQGNHTYTLRSTAKHPVTIQVRGKDGKVSTIVIEGRANRVRKRGGVTYFVNGDGGERYMVRTRTPEPPTPPMLERDAVPPIPPMPEDFEVARPGSPAAPPAPPLRSDDDYFQVAPPAMPGDATPVPPEPPEAAAPDTVIVGRGPDKTIVRQDIVVDGGPLAIVQADPVIKDDAVFQVRGNKDAPTTEEHRREIEALRKQKLRAAYEAGQRAGDSVKREMASQSEGTMTRANAEAMKKAFAAEREAMRNMMAADSVKREMASQSEGTMTRANAETMKKAFAAEREAMRKAMAAERESQRDIMGKAVRIRTDEMARAQKDLARAAADEGGHRSLHQLLEQAAREAEANGNKKAAEQIRNLIGQLSK
jgi:beta-lactamase regulating signal transducer with metallopeptidase domain